MDLWIEKVWERITSVANTRSKRPFDEDIMFDIMIIDYCRRRVHCSIFNVQYVTNYRTSAFLNK